MKTIIDAANVDVNTVDIKTVDAKTVDVCSVDSYTGIGDASPYEVC